MFRVSIVLAGLVLGAALSSSSTAFTSCGSIVPFGTPCPVPTSLSVLGCATPGGSLSISIDGFVTPSAGLLLVGFAQGNTPSLFGCTLYVNNLFPSPLPFVVSPQSQLALFGEVPHNAAGLEIYLQAILIPNDTPGISIPTFTNGVHVTVS